MHSAPATTSAAWPHPINELYIAFVCVCVCPAAWPCMRRAILPLASYIIVCVQRHGQQVVDQLMGFRCGGVEKVSGYW